MLTLLLSLRDCFRARAFLQAEILALRHQLLVSFAKTPAETQDGAVLGGVGRRLSVR